MRKITLALFIAALLCGVANQVSAQAPPTTVTAVPVETTGTTIVNLPPGGSATISVTFPKAKPAKGKKAETGRVPVVTAEELAQAVAAMKQFVAAAALPRTTRTRADGAVITDTVLPRDVCPPGAMRRAPDGSYACPGERHETYNPALVAEAQGNHIRGLTEEVAGAMRKTDDASQRTELMVGGGALGVMNLGGGPVAVADLFVDTKRVITNVVLHGAVGELSDGQGTTGCVAVGGAKPFEAGGATTVGVLGGYCFTTNADLAHSNFWHADLQFRHRMTRWLVLGFDVLGGALWAERVVNQTVREVRDPAFGALGSLAVNFSL